MSIAETTKESWTTRPRSRSKAQAPASFIDNRGGLAVLLAIMAVGFIALSDVFAKKLSPSYGAFELVYFRALIGALLLGLVMARRRLVGPRAKGPLVAAPGLQILRGFGAFAAISLFFIGLAELPLANAIAMSATAPIFMALAGRFLLGERISPRLWLFMMLGCAGVVVLIHPVRLSGPLWPYVSIIASAVFYALTAVATRRLAARDSAQCTALLTFIVAIIGAAAISLAAEGALPGIHWIDLPMIVGLGLSGALGMYVYAAAYRFAGVGDLAPWDNFVFLWALIFGFAFFTEIPDGSAVAGGALIVLSGLLVSLNRPSKPPNA